MLYFDKKKKFLEMLKSKCILREEKKLYNYCLSKLFKIFFVVEYEGCGVFSFVFCDDGCVIC